MAVFVTHGIFASLFSILWNDKKTKTTVFILIFIASILPDIDFLFQERESRMFGHRGFTHSILFALFTAGLFTLISSSLVKSFWRRLLLFTLFFLASASHSCLDAMTQSAYGVCFFCPFNEERYFFPFTPFSSIAAGGGHKGFRPGLGNSVWITLLPEIFWVWIPTFAIYFFVYFSGKKDSNSGSKKNTTMFKPIQMKPRETKNTVKPTTPKKK